MSMSKIIGGMGVTLWADSRQFKKGMDEARSSLKRFSNEMPLHEKRMADWKKRQADAARTMTMFKVGLAGLAAGAIYAVGQGVEDLAVNYEELTKSMNRALSVFGKLSKEQRKAMTESAIGVSRNTLFTTDQAAQAMKFVGSAGYNAEDARTLMPAFAEFAQAGQFDMAQAVNYAADAQAALGMKTESTAQNLKNLTRITDVLTKANILSNAEVEDFSAALTNRAAGSLRLVNKELEEGVAVLAAFAEQGIKGEKAGESLSIVMRDLQTKAIKNKEAFRTAGVSVYDAAGNMRNMADIIGDLETRLYGLSDAQKKQAIMGLGITDRSVAQLQSLVGMSGKIRDYQRQLEEAGGVTKEVSDSIMTDHEKALRRTAAGWDVLSNKIGSYKTLWESTKADLLENVTNTSSGQLAAVERQKQWKLDNGYLDPVTGRDAFAEADAMSGGLPNAEGRERIRRQIIEGIRRRELANQGRDQMSQWFAMPFNAGGQSSSLSSGIGAGFDFVNRGRQMTGNLVQRLEEMAAAQVMRDMSKYKDFGKSLLGVPGMKANLRDRNSKTIGQLFSSLVDDVGGIAGKRIGGFRLGNMASGAMNAPFSLPGLLQSGLEGMEGWKALEEKSKRKNASSRNSLSLFESGSADAYRQQAAIAAQDPLSREGFSQRVRSTNANSPQMKVAQKQLTAAEKMEKHLKVIAANSRPMAPANI